MEARRSGASPRDVPRSMPSATAIWLIPYLLDTHWMSYERLLRPRITHEDVVVAEFGNKASSRWAAMNRALAHEIKIRFCLIERFDGTADHKGECPCCGTDNACSIYSISTTSNARSCHAPPETGASTIPPMPVPTTCRETSCATWTSSVVESTKKRCSP